MASLPGQMMVPTGDPFFPGGASVVTPETPGPIAPAPGENQVDGVGERSRRDDARAIYESHVKGLQARRQRDLLSEKLLLHIDGSGDNQWADIFDGTRVEIPRYVSEFRKTENLLRLLVDNAVAHHTTMPLRYFAESGPDRRSREKAMIDMMWANYLAHVQYLNGVFAEAMYLAMPAGFCPTHGYWRDDVAQDWYEGLYSDESIQMTPTGPYDPRGPGMIDCFVGNPWDHVFDPSARRGSYRWQSYGRQISGDLFRQAFAHVPGAKDLEGSTRLSSASEFQQIAQDWRMEGLQLHGSPVLESRRDNEDLITVICRETAPGVLTDHRQGRLQIIAVPGEVDTRRGEGNESHALLVADQPLPGADFSSSVFYSHHRGSDIHGKPWVEDIDQLQVDLNIAISKKWEAINRMIEAPIVAPGGSIAEDLMDMGGYNLLEVEPSLAGWRPRVMEWPSAVIAALDKQIEDYRRAIYTGGGYQAASRGEAPGTRTPYRAIVALQQADNTVHGPVNMRFRRSACDFMGRCWSQMKRYGDVPWMVDIVGDEYAHLVDPYIDATRLSDKPPHFKLVNAFGATPEVRAQELLQLMQTRGADGRPFLTTEEARRQWPNEMVFGMDTDPAHVKRRRAKTVAKAAETLAADVREQWQFEEQDITHPWVQRAAQYVFFQLESKHPRLRDDDLQAHLNAYSELAQDETADPIARLAIMQRQDLYYQWQAAQAGAMRQAQAEGPAGNGRQRPPDGQMDRSAIAQQTQGGGGPAGAMVSATAR